MRDVSGPVSDRQSIRSRASRISGYPGRRVRSRFGGAEWAVPRADDPTYALSGAVRRINDLIVGSRLEDGAVAGGDRGSGGRRRTSSRSRPPRAAAQGPPGRFRAGPGLLSRRARSSGSPTRSPLRCTSRRCEAVWTARCSSTGQYEGPPGCVHGGVIASVFDEMLGAANIAGGFAGDDRDPHDPVPQTHADTDPDPARVALRGPRRPQDQNQRVPCTTATELTAEAGGDLHRALRGAGSSAGWPNPLKDPVRSIPEPKLSGARQASSCPLATEWCRMSREEDGRAVTPEMDLLMWSVVDSSPDMLCLLDVSGEILRVSGAEELILGYPGGEPDREFLDRSRPPGRCRCGEEDFDRVASSEVLRFEARLRLARADGTWATVSMRARTIFDSEGAPMAIVSASRDVTGEMAREQKLLKAVSAAEQANRAKSEFFSRMSHELRTPLNSVLGFAQLLEMDELSPSQEEAVAHILRAGRHLLDLIDEVLDISRIETGNLELQIEPVELQALVMDAVGLTSPLADKAGITVSVGGSLEPAACVRADRQRLLQVLLNLLSNAVQVQLRRREGEGHLRGAACRARRGRRQRYRGRDPRGGHGASVRALRTTGRGADRHRRVRSGPHHREEPRREDGRGSRGLLAGRARDRRSRSYSSKPRSPLPSAGRATDAPDPQSPAQPACVLLIEDNLANLTLIENVLNRRGGVKLLAAMHGTLGIDLAREHHPDLVLLDLHLPDQSGADVLQRLQSDQDTAGIPVVVVSADRSSDQDRAMRELGAVDYLIKPFDVRDLLRTVDAGARRLRAERRPQMARSRPSQYGSLSLRL